MRRIPSHLNFTCRRALIGLEYPHAKPICSATDNIQLSLKNDDIRLLLQSLDHCLATCTKKAAGAKDAPCEDCDRAGTCASAFRN